MTAAGPAGQDTKRPVAGEQCREREIEVEEILRAHLDYLDGQGRAFHVWTVTRADAGSKYGLGKLSEAQLREFGRQIAQLLEPAATGPDGDQGPDTSRTAAAAGLLEGLSAPGRCPHQRRHAGPDRSGRHGKRGRASD